MDGRGGGDRKYYQIPEKIVFGSDAFPYSREVNVPATYWLGVETARTALAVALAEMVSAGEIAETNALAIARGYFHDNTAKLFGLPTLPVRIGAAAGARQLSSRWMRRTRRTNSFSRLNALRSCRRQCPVAADMRLISAPGSSVPRRTKSRVFGGAKRVAPPSAISGFSYGPYHLSRHGPCHDGLCPCDDGPCRDRRRQFCSLPLPGPPARRHH
jgi:hypothetical protein